MAKALRQAQVEGQLVNSVTGTGVDNTDPKNPVINLSALQNKVVTNIGFSGTGSKTLTITFQDGSTLQSSFIDLDTTYSTLTAALLNAGTSNVPGVIAPDVLVNYLNARLASVLSWKGTVQNFGSLPGSGQKTGDVYNIIDAFSYQGKNYPAGSNVAWSGSDWDVLHGFIDTSVFLTQETDPKGVQKIVVTGTTNKTIEITLRDGTIVTGNFTDNDTTYTKGTMQQLQAGTDNTGQVWSAEVLTAFILSLGVTVYQEVFTIVPGNISGGVVNLALSQSNALAQKLLVFLNGLKQPLAAQQINGNNLRLTQASLPTDIIATDEVEVFYLK